MTELARLDTFEAIEPAYGLAVKLAKTEFVPSSLRNRPEAVMASILAGRELGIPPIQSLRSIYVIEGKPTLAAVVQRAMILAAGHTLRTIDYTTQKVTLGGTRRGEEIEHVVTWTIADAERAQLTGKKIWRNYPRQMLLARCTSELAQLVFADVTLGLSSPEDFGLYIDEGGAPQGDDTPPKPARKRRTKPDAAEIEERDIIDVTPLTSKPSPDHPSMGGRDEPIRAEIIDKGITGPPADRPAAAKTRAKPPLPNEVEAVADTPAPDAPEAVLAAEPIIPPDMAQRLAIHGQKSGLDNDLRHDLIALLTDGRKRSSKELTYDEEAVVRSVIDDIGYRRVEVSYDADGKLVLHRLDDDAMPDRPEQWRGHAAEAGWSPAQLLLEVRSLAKEEGFAPPSSNDELDSALETMPVTAKEKLRTALLDPPF